jgi:ABC-type nitrate/sulfonate/bicarbonate transport system permease component
MVLYLWNRLPADSKIVVYFERPRTILDYLHTSGSDVFHASLWCFITAVASLVLASLIVFVFLMVGLYFDHGVQFIERLAATSQTVPFLVIVALSLLFEQSIFLSLNLRDLAPDWYCLFPVTVSLAFTPFVNGVGAIRRLPVSLKQLLQIWDMQRFRRIWHIYLPYVLPDVLTGIRASATWAVSAVLITEALVNGVSTESHTLGRSLALAFSTTTPGRTPTVLLVATVLGFLVYYLFDALQHLLELLLLGKIAEANEKYPLQSVRVPFTSTT